MLRHVVAVKSVMLKRLAREFAAIHQLHEIRDVNSQGAGVFFQFTLRWEVEQFHQSRNIYEVPLEHKTGL